MGKVTLALALCVLAVYSQAASSKVSHGVQQQLRVPGAAPKVMVIFKDNAVVYSQFKRQTFATKVAKQTAVINTLKAFSASSQKNAVALLNAKTASAHKSFWISNSMEVTGADAATISHLAALPEVVEIREPKVAHISPAVKSSTLVPEWGIAKTGAPAQHAKGNLGQGIKVSNIDTGVRYTHEALVQQYANDGYSWYDPYTGSENPVDQNGHGTHTMGTIAGSNDIGMAPGATWIACRGCDTSSCTENALLACAQFIACPHPYNDEDNCDVSKIPDVVNNSWGGGQGDDWYDSSIRAWENAGIVPVFSNGNSGAFCGTANSPADSLLAIGVGSTDDRDDLSYFSSVGPAQNGGHIKPDISAPGSDVRSAYNTGDTAYTTMSGTSMAGPHVAGAVALYLQANPGATVAQVKQALYSSASQNVGSGAGTCAGVSEDQFPNHSFGHGIVNVASF